MLSTGSFLSFFFFLLLDKGHSKLQFFRSAAVLLKERLSDISLFS